MATLLANLGSQEVRIENGVLVVYQDGSPTSTTLDLRSGPYLIHVEQDHGFKLYYASGTLSSSVIYTNVFDPKLFGEESSSGGMFIRAATISQVSGNIYGIDGIGVSTIDDILRCGDPEPAEYQHVIDLLTGGVANVEISYDETDSNNPFIIVRSNDNQQMYRRINVL